MFWNNALPDQEDDEQALHDVMVATRDACEDAERYVPVTKRRTPYNASAVVSAVYLNDTHRGVARVTFAPGVNSASFTIRDIAFTATRPTGKLGAWVAFGPILDFDNLTFDDAQAMSLDDANILTFAGTNALSFDGAQGLTFAQANAYPN
ncbi:MAG TPA: hypothetical protein VF669_07475 [Tepidisphaeraceae bacterium]